MIGGIEATAAGAEHGLSAPARVDGMVLTLVAVIGQHLPRLPQKNQGPPCAPRCTSGSLSCVGARQTRSPVPQRPVGRSRSPCHRQMLGELRLGAQSQDVPDFTD